jgi:phage shock protein PspC (stress-responsive transcriptional regulator)
MQRVVSINLNGNVYQLEETGYTALFAFLDARETLIQDDPDRAQKMADLEHQVAEKCAAFVTPTKSVITSAEIDRIIREFGPLPVADAEPSPKYSQQGPQGQQGQQGRQGQQGSTASASGSTSSGPAGVPFPHRRLYQIREGAMISGVCVGLSEYMHIDVTLLRILFVIFALVSAGWGILAYGALMFILPHATTRADAAAGTAPGTHAWPWDNGGWPWDRYGWPWDRPTPAQQQARTQDAGAPRSDAPKPASSTPPPATPPPPPPPPASMSSQPEWRDSRDAWREQRRQWHDQRREWREQRRAARMDYHPWPVWGTASMIIFMIFAFMWLSFWTRGHFFFGWPFFWGFPHWVGIVFFFMVMRWMFMPWPRWSGYAPYAHPHYGWIAMWNGLAWFAMMIFGIWVAYHFVPEFRDFIQSFQAGYNDNYRL